MSKRLLALIIVLDLIVAVGVGALVWLILTFPTLPQFTE